MRAYTVHTLLEIILRPVTQLYDVTHRIVQTIRLELLLYSVPVIGIEVYVVLRRNGCYNVYVSVLYTCIIQYADTHT